MKTNENPWVEINSIFPDLWRRSPRNLNPWIIVRIISIVHWASHKLASRLKWAKEINSFHSVLYSSPFFPSDFQSPVSTHETVLLTLFDRRPQSVLFVNVIFRDDEAAAAAEKRFRYALFFIFPSPLTNIE